jgi:ABC-type branched-subunit amino acid transport system substrate-binding protein
VFAEPFKREVFALYTNYVVESALLTRHAVNTLKKTKFAVFHLNNAYGLEGVRGVTEELRRPAYRNSGASLVAVVPHEQTETSLAVQALRLKESGADAVVLYTQDTAAIALLREFARIGYGPQLLLSSTLLGPSMFQAGPAFNGAIIASFLPVPGLDPKADQFLAGIARYADPADAVKNDPFRVLAGAAFAQVLVEGLKRAGPNLDRNRFIAAMERLQDWKEGLFNKVSFSALDRQGNNAVYLVRARFQPAPGFDRVSGWVEFADR